jgi:antitoxin ParD1/3/4
MTIEQTRNVSLTAEMNAFIRGQVNSGRYQNASEVVRAALRLLQDQERPIRRESDPAAKRAHRDAR